MNRKSELRKRLKRARLELTDAERTVMSRAIVERLEHVIDWSKISTVHYFEPMSELMEPDISSFVTYLQDNFENIKLFTPRLVGGEWRTVARQAGDIPETFDVVIVPMLGFAPDTLHRIGYGGGFYDKFLKVRPQAQKIGVCYDQGRVTEKFIEGHDVALDIIVTDIAVERLSS